MRRDNWGLAVDLSGVAEHAAKALMWLSDPEKKNGEMMAAFELDMLRPQLMNVLAHRRRLRKKEAARYKQG